MTCCWPHLLNQIAKDCLLQCYVLLVLALLRVEFVRLGHLFCSIVSILHLRGYLTTFPKDHVLLLGQLEVRYVLKRYRWHIGLEIEATVLRHRAFLLT